MLKKLKKKLTQNEFEDKVVNGRFNKFNQTPLMKICFSGNLELLQYFVVDLKADLSILDLKDENCLFAAVKGNHPEIVEFILKNKND